MIKKTENCLYCGEKMESVTAKKKFCSNLHRVYWNREKQMGTLGKEFVIKDGKAELVDYKRNSVLPTPTDANTKSPSKFKVYDYSAMPSGLLYPAREAWKKKARAEQDKNN